MKNISKNFIDKLRDIATSRPVTRVKLYTKYPGPIRSIAGTCFTLNGVVARTVSVYGNAVRFFQQNDNIIIRTTPLTNIGTILNTPTFDGTDTWFSINTIYLDQTNLGGHVLRDMDSKFTVGAT